MDQKICIRYKLKLGQGASVIGTVIIVSGHIIGEMLEKIYSQNRAALFGCNIPDLSAYYVEDVCGIENYRFWEHFADPANRVEEANAYIVEALPPNAPMVYTTRSCENLYSIYKKLHRDKFNNEDKANEEKSSSTYAFNDKNQEIDFTSYQDDEINVKLFAAVQNSITTKPEIVDLADCALEENELEALMVNPHVSEVEIGLGLVYIMSLVPDHLSKGAIVVDEKANSRELYFLILVNQLTRKKPVIVYHENNIFYFTENDLAMLPPSDVNKVPGQVLRLCDISFIRAPADEEDYGTYIHRRLKYLWRNEFILTLPVDQVEHLVKSDCKWDVIPPSAGLFHDVIQKLSKKKNAE